MEGLPAESSTVGCGNASVVYATAANTSGQRGQLQGVVGAGQCGKLMGDGVQLTKDNLQPLLGNNLLKAIKAYQVMNLESG